jgi:hypothetical protein
VFDDRSGNFGGFQGSADAPDPIEQNLAATQTLTERTLGQAEARGKIRVAPSAPGACAWLPRGQACRSIG